MEAFSVPHDIIWCYNHRRWLLLWSTARAVYWNNMFSSMGPRLVAWASQGMMTGSKSEYYEMKEAVSPFLLRVGRLRISLLPCSSAR